MRIGELAASAGIPTKTIRFYETEGLLPEPPRTSSGYRVYSEGDVSRLNFILKAKQVGFSLQEIKGVLYLYDQNEPTCIHVRELLEHKITQVDMAIKELERVRDELEFLRDTSETLGECGEDGEICIIIEQQGMAASVGDAKVLTRSRLICPKCGYAESLEMPSDACQFFQQCSNCEAILRPQDGDCCVFCSYGDVPCPSKQLEEVG